MATRDESGAGEGEAFGPYRVCERLGVGGMATVHRAIACGIEGFERSVALKRLLPHLAEDEKFVRAFVREAKLASMLAHPHIVQIFELGRVGPVYFISMEMIEGHDVRKILRQSRRVTGPPPVSVVVSLLTQTCDALEYAHTRADERGNPLGLVHRDVSPSNLLVTHGGHVKVIDFGIAKATVDHLRTQTGHVKGKMAYMSPEAINGRGLDARSDLFSLGVVAHELVTARPLFATKNEYQTLMRVQKAAIAPPSTYNQTCPAELDAIIMRALDRDRDARWASAADMREQLLDLALRYNLNAGPRVVADWMEYAFSLEVPRGDISSKISTTTGTPARPTPRPFAGKTPPPAVFFTRGERDTPHTGPTGAVSLPPAEEDDEVVEIAWGGRAETPMPVLIEGITDYSGGVAAPATTAPAMALTPPSARLQTNPGKKVRGTYLPGLTEEEEEDEDLLLERPDTSSRSMEIELPAAHPVDHRELELRPLVPRVTMRQASASWPTAEGTPAKGSGSHRLLPAVTAEPAPAPTAAEPPPARPAGATRSTGPRPVASADLAAPTARPDSEPSRPIAVPREFGAAIIAREQRRAPVLAIALIAGAAATAGVATYVLLRDDPRPAVTEVDAPATRAPVAAVAPTAHPARLVVRSTPPGMEVSIDGALVDGVTPIDVEVAPGRHLIAVESDGEVLWRQELDVIVGGHFELHPVVVAPERRSHRKRDRARYRTPTLAAPDRGNVPVDDRLAPTTGPLAPAVPAGTAAAPAPAPASPAPAPAAPAIKPPAPITAPTASVPPVRRAPTPVVVPPNAVSKRSGAVPTLRARGGEDIPRLISAQLCIDEGGRVTSAKLLSRVPDEVSGTLTSALRGWRYSPYRDATGAKLPACFAVNFKAR